MPPMLETALIEFTLMLPLARAELLALGLLGALGLGLILLLLSRPGVGWWRKRGAAH